MDRDGAPGATEERRVALVTGASGSLGRAICLALAAEGADIVAHYHEHEEPAAQVVEAVVAGGRQGLAVAADITDAAAAEALIARAEEAFGHVDVLVNNAGIVRDDLLFEMQPSSWAAVINLNLTGAFNCIHAAIPGMLIRRSGVIVNVSSVIAEIGWPGQSNYAAAKAGMNALTRCAAMELARFNIRVNAVAPGVIENQLTEQVRNHFGQRLEQLIPTRRFGLPAEVADVVAFLASDRASYITGEIIDVNGGLGVGLPLA
jgi:3-oxoacyl-[acyl-carrier protein] reductase